jgi:hypothetical protein
MKKLLTIVSLFLGILFSCQQSANKEVKDSTSSFIEANEKDSIMKLIENETECFYRRDYNGWKESRAQTAYSYQGWSNPDGTFDVMVGWNAIDEKLKKYIIDNPVPEGGTSHPKVVRKNMLFKFFGENVAYTVWDQYNQDSDLKKYYYSKDSRIVEKIEGKWKIVNVTSFWDYKNLIPTDSLKL